MPLQEINGQWIYYEDTGGHLLPIVLAHGWLMDHEMFAPQLEALRSRYRMITWDARCHGQTETTDDPFTYWDLADDMTGLLDHLGITRAVICGMSQGGFVALRFALKHPERVAALILLGTQAGTEDPEKLPIFGSMVEVWATEGLNDEVAEMLAALNFGPEWPGRETWIAKWYQLPRSVLRPAFKALAGRDDIHDRLGEIKVPALVIHGDADAAIDLERAQRLSFQLANSQPLVTIAGGGHVCNLTHPELVNLVLQRYLAEISPQTPRGAERRSHGRRSNASRRLGERRDPVRAGAGRRVLFPFERRSAERRRRERRKSWPINSQSTANS
jgi:pimeloyl-ACP methyl ester carboxylesterase